MPELINKAAEFIRKRCNVTPETGIVLGTGLGGLTKEIGITHTIPYSDIPGFRQPTVEGHSGNLLFGRLSGRDVVAMQGRFHYYEGYTMEDVVFPVRVMKALGIRRLALSNASGGLNPAYVLGDLMVISDHIALLLPELPLRGRNDDLLGPRFPDLLHAYAPAAVRKALDCARANGITAHAGVYAAVPGPHLETPAEYRMLRLLGADAVGMSTVPEVIAARHLGLECFAVSIITDLGVEGKIGPVTIEKVIATAMEAEPKMTTVMKEVIGWWQ